MTPAARRAAKARPAEPAVFRGPPDRLASLLLPTSAVRSSTWSSSRARASAGRTSVDSTVRTLARGDCARETGDPPPAADDAARDVQRLSRDRGAGRSRSSPKSSPFRGSRPSRAGSRSRPSRLARRPWTSSSSTRATSPAMSPVRRRSASSTGADWSKPSGLRLPPTLRRAGSGSTSCSTSSQSRTAASSRQESRAGAAIEVGESRAGAADAAFLRPAASRVSATRARGGSTGLRIPVRITTPAAKPKRGHRGSTT